ncbi:hypothetical protein ACFCZT_18275 [Streptomyces sp. NPDC056230]|uniref:hypothetical protein n=1 Tax=Streptomyces sp. NPDC056230 TaxID=3345754 RepID=UPI0035D94133
MGPPGLRVSPGNTVNGLDEGGTEEICPEPVTALADSGLAHLHIVRADPENPVHQRIRKDWPSTLIGRGRSRVGPDIVVTAHGRSGHPATYRGDGGNRPSAPEPRARHGPHGRH